MSDIEMLAKELVITEERQQEIDLMKRRLVVKHSLVLHRDSASARDLKKMIEAMEATGMPEHATLKVDGQDNHTRMYATWSTELTEPAK